jgi:hypothetical protein
MQVGLTEQKALNVVKPVADVTVGLASAERKPTPPPR